MSIKGKGRGIEFIRAHVAYRGDDCLTWPLSCDDKGYAILAHNGGRYKAARYMCELVHGATPADKPECAHSCGKGHLGCVNPRHLSWASRSANQRDRRRHGTHGKPGVIGRSKLLPKDIEEIKRLKGSMSQYALAHKFRCSPSNISKIVNGRRWKKPPNWLRLTASDVEAIRAMRGKRMQKDIAADYGVDRNVIGRIFAGGYKHVKAGAAHD